MIAVAAECYLWMHERRGPVSALGPLAAAAVVEPRLPVAAVEEGQEADQEEHPAAAEAGRRWAVVEVGSLAREAAGEAGEARRVVVAPCCRCWQSPS